MIHAHFQDCDLRILRHGKNRHRHTNIVIVIGRGLFHFISGTQNRGNHLLGRALAHRAGHTDYLHADPIPLTTGDIAQRDAGIRNHDSRIVFVAMGAQHSSRTFFHRIRNKHMAIPLAL